MNWPKNSIRCYFLANAVTMKAYLSSAFQWEVSSRSSLAFLHIFWAEALDTFISDHPSKKLLFIENNFGRERYLPLEQRVSLLKVLGDRDPAHFQNKGVACLLPFIKELGSLHSGFLFCTGVHLTLSPGPVEISAWGTATEVMTF